MRPTPEQDVVRAEPARPPGPGLRWPRWADAVVAVAVFTYNLPIQGLTPGWRGWVALLIPVGLCLPYGWRRRAPVVVFLVVWLVAVAQIPLGVGLVPADAMLVLALYGVARRRRSAVSGSAALAAGAWAAAVVAPRLGAYNWSVVDLLLLLLVVAVTWLVGTLRRTRAQYVESLVLRAEQAEQERRAQAVAAATAERIRIARELHDVVAHHLSAISLLADGAALQLRADPAVAEAGILSVRDSSRRAMAEMRAMLSVLRTTDSPLPAPQPGLDQLEELVAESVAVGVPARLRVCADRPELAAGVQLAVYRLVQEALTNARKHGGPDLREVAVTIEFARDEVTVTVAHDGVVLAAGYDPFAGGHGLAGMRERVTAAGGTLSAGGRPTGGFEVRAVIPVAGQP